MSKKANLADLVHVSGKACVLISVPELIIVGASPAYSHRFGRATVDIVGRNIVDIFRTRPGYPNAMIIENLKCSIEQAISKKLPNSIELSTAAITQLIPPVGVSQDLGWRFIHTPLLDAVGEVTFLIQSAASITEITQQVDSANWLPTSDVAETQRVYKSLANKLQQVERARARQAFQLELADAIRHLATSSDIFEKTSELLGKYLYANRVLFGEYDVQRQFVTYHSNYVGEGSQALLGTYPSANFGASNFASLENGPTWVAGDMQHDPRTASPEVWPTFHVLGIYAAVVVPLKRYGSLIACLFVNDNRARLWTQDEVSLIEDAAERAWNAVERIRVEEALRDADRRKNEFLAMLGHELRNPLAPISAAAALLQITASNPERVLTASKIITRQVGHMTSLINDLLDVSRVTTGLVVLDKERLDLKQVVADAIEQACPLIEARGHTLTREYPPENTFVQGDYKRLVQVFANLLNNAAKYTPRGGNLRLEIVLRDKEVIAFVQDNGIGIADELLPKVFDLFSQGQRTADRAQGGLGLGLALVKRIVELHGGTVAVTCETPSNGSRFAVTLPLLMNYDRQIVTADRRPERSNETSLLRVLIVEDCHDAAKMLGLLVETLGHEVTMVFHPQDALEKVKNEQYDAYLLDIGLPEMDGIELMQRLRGVPSGRSALMVAITGYGQHYDRGNTVKAGFDHYFIKPIDAAKLATLLADTCSQPTNTH